tara:strand:+ start:13150 stop:13578 length:429 start_codon:yes stop_codon:yes gene_type:complete
MEVDIGGMSVDAKKYLVKIIANDNEGLKLVSALSAGAKIKISNIKFLKANKIFLLSMERIKTENQNNKKKINSILKFDYISKSKSKNIDQKNKNLVLELIAIDYLKNKENYEIDLIFTNNAHIALSTEAIEVTLEDQNEIKK